MLSNVPPIAKDLEKNNCGLIISNNPYEIDEKIIELLNNRDKLKVYRDNDVKYRNQFDWENIFRNII